MWQDSGDRLRTVAQIVRSLWSCFWSGICIPEEKRVTHGRDKGGNVQLRTSCKDRWSGGRKNSLADANNAGGHRRESD